MRKRNFDAILRELFAADLPKVIFDVGGHNGSSIQRFKKVFSHLPKIYSFEANPDLAVALNTKYAEDADVIICGKAVSEYDGVKVTFNIHDVSTGSSSLLKVNKHREFAKRRNLDFNTIHPIKVDCINLDSYTNRMGIPFINLLKIDTQGSELSVLKGAKNLLQNNSIGVIEFELIAMDAYETSIGAFEVLSFLDSYGYKLLAFSNDSRSSNTGFSDILANHELQMDLIFVSSGLYANLNL